MMNKQAEQKMTKAKQVVVGTVVDFSKSSAATYVCLGKATVTSIKHGRVKAHYEVMPKEGKYAGKLITLTVRYEGGANGDLSYYATIVGEDVSDVKAATVKKVKRAEKAFEAYKALDAKDIEPGDIVTVEVTSKGTKYDFRVYEIDHKKCRIKGWQDGRMSYEVGTRMGWASYNHPEVKITMKTKKAFDPRNDDLAATRERKAAVVGEKRATTTARRKQLRNYFGNM
jgi:hypothetical protein